MNLSDKPGIEKKKKVILVNPLLRFTVIKKKKKVSQDSIGSNKLAKYSEKDNSEKFLAGRRYVL